MEQKFDSFFKDFSVNPVIKPLELNKDQELSDDTCSFSHNDLGNKRFKSKDDYSVCTDKGSEGDGHKEPVNTETGQNTSTFWKRIDMRQKKIIRGLSALTKEYFKKMISAQKSKQEIVSDWDEHIRKHFPELHNTSRLMLLGHISVM